VSSWLILIKVRLPCFFSFYIGGVEKLNGIFVASHLVKAEAGFLRYLASSAACYKYALTVQGKSLRIITQIKTLQYILSISSTYVYANNISLGVHTCRIIRKEAKQQLLF
jgi:hypothetical protein